MVCWNCKSKNIVEQLETYWLVWKKKKIESLAYVCKRCGIDTMDERQTEIFKSNLRKAGIHVDHLTSVPAVRSPAGELAPETIE